MRRKALIVLLALGTLGGYASGFASLRACHNQRRESFEQHVARVCVDAARGSDAAAKAQAQPQTNAPTPVIVNIHPGAPAGGNTPNTPPSGAATAQ